MAGRLWVQVRAQGQGHESAPGETGPEGFELAPGDCLRMATDGEHGFHNPGAEPAHYLVVARPTRVADLPAPPAAAHSG